MDHPSVVRDPLDAIGRSHRIQDLPERVRATPGGAHPRQQTRAGVEDEGPAAPAVAVGGAAAAGRGSPSLERVGDAAGVLVSLDAQCPESVPGA